MIHHDTGGLDQMIRIYFANFRGNVACKGKYPGSK